MGNNTQHATHFGKVFLRLHHLIIYNQVGIFSTSQLKKHRLYKGNGFFSKYVLGWTKSGSSRSALVLHQLGCV